MPSGYELVLNVGANTEGVKKGLAETKKSIEKLSAETKKMGNGFRGTTTGMLGSIKKIRADLGAVSFAVTAVTAAVGAVGLSAHKTADGFKEMERTAKRMGVTTAEFSKLAVVAKQSGINVDTLGDAMKDLNVKITDASLGAKAYEDVFNKLGLKSAELVKLDPAEQFYKFSDAIKKADENTRRFALDEINDAMFQMIPLMEKGGKEIKEMVKQAGELGQSFDAKEAKVMQDYNAEVLALEAAMSVLGKEVAEYVLPAMTSLAEWGTDLIKIFSDDIKEANNLTEALKDMREEGEKLKKSLETGETMMSSGSVSMGGLSQETLKATTNLEAFNEQAKALENAGKSVVAYTFGGVEGNFKVPNLDAPAVEPIGDVSSAFQEALGSPDNNGGVGGALARLMEENELKKEIKLAHDAEMLNLDFEHMLAMGEQAEESRRIEEDTQKRFYDREFGWAKDHLDRLQRLEKVGFQGRLRMGIEFLDNLATATQGRSRKMFEFQKAATTGEAIISTIGGVTKALNNPYPMNLAFAASVAAAGAAQIAKIQSTTFGGGGGGGGAAGIGASVPSQASAQQAAPENVLDATFNIQGSSVSADSVRQLGSSLNEYIEDGFRIRSVQVV